MIDRLWNERQLFRLFPWTSSRNCLDKIPSWRSRRNRNSYIFIPWSKLARSWDKLYFLRIFKLRGRVNCLVRVLVAMLVGLCVLWDQTGFWEIVEVRFLVIVVFERYMIFNVLLKIEWVGEFVGDLIVGFYALLLLVRVVLVLDVRLYGLVLLFYEVLFGIGALWVQLEWFLWRFSAEFLWALLLLDIWPVIHWVISFTLGIFLTIIRNISFWW